MSFLEFLLQAVMAVCATVSVILIIFVVFALGAPDISEQMRISFLIATPLWVMATAQLARLYGP